MMAIAEFFSKGLIFYVVVMIFSVFAFVGYLHDSKTGIRRKIEHTGETIKPKNSYEEQINQIKNSVANKSLNSLISDNNSNSMNNNDTL